MADEFDNLAVLCEQGRMKCAVENSCETKIKISSVNIEDPEHGGEMEHESETFPELDLNDQAQEILSDLDLNDHSTFDVTSVDEENYLRSISAEIELVVTENATQSEETKFVTHFDQSGEGNILADEDFRSSDNINIFFQDNINEIYSEYYNASDSSSSSSSVISNKQYLEDGPNISSIGLMPVDDLDNELFEEGEKFSDELIYSLFKFHVDVKGENEECNHVPKEENEEKGDNLESQKSQLKSTRLRTTRFHSSSSPKNFISLEAWIDDGIDVETDFKENFKVEDTEEVQIRIIGSEESTRLHDQIMREEVLTIFEECDAAEGSISVSSPSVRCSISIYESRKGCEGISRRRSGFSLSGQECGEIIPWKQQTPLRSLLKENIQEASQQTLTLIPLTKQMRPRPLSMKSRKDWNSPAKLRGVDHRRVKARPLWVPFICCPSIY